jgi:hypothetical protein
MASIRNRLVFGVAAMLISLLSIAPCLEADAGKGAINVVIVFPGGPDAGDEGQRMIKQFLDIMAEQGNFGKSGIAGAYFTDTEKAIEHLTENRDAFVMGSLGFFLSQKEKLGLAPVAKVELAHGGEERFYLVIKKGAFSSLAEMKGKTIAGNTLYEDPVFLSRIVFENKVDISSHFQLAATTRPLSAIRKVVRGSLDGVLLDGAQYESLCRLPLFDQLETIHKSPLLPPLGLMMVDGENTRGKKKLMLNALKDMCKLKEGKEACENFGIRGFDAITEKELAWTIAAYEN